MEKVVGKKIRRNNSIYRKGGNKFPGGMLEGPSHEYGGIPARIKPTKEMIELEGQEYVLNAESTKALGTDFLDKLNKTGTAMNGPGGFTPGELTHHGSNYREGGKIRLGENNMRRRRKFATGGRPHINCPPPTFWNGTECVHQVPPPPDPGLRNRKSGVNPGTRRRGTRGRVINSNAPKRLTPEQMSIGQFGSEVRGCNCRWSGWWSNWYCTGSNCQNSGALCWNNHAVCSERPPDPKDKHPKHGHYGRGGRIRRFSGGGQTRGNGPNSCLDGNGNNVSC